MTQYNRNVEINLVTFEFAIHKFLHQFLSKKITDSTFSIVLVQCTYILK